jgi:hypothetical protein
MIPEIELSPLRGSFCVDQPNIHFTRSGLIDRSVEMWDWSGGLAED